jgi:hypothetical protein
MQLLNYKAFMMIHSYVVNRYYMILDKKSSQRS